MKDNNDRNRPVHLARRDACYEKAVELLYIPAEEWNTAARLNHVGRVIWLLEASVRHAGRAVRSNVATQREKDFLYYLQMVLRNVGSVLALMKNQEHLEKEKQAFLAQFLGDRRDEALLSIANYQRHTRDMIHGLWHILRLSQSSYMELRKESVAGLTGPDADRYQKAYTSCREQMDLLHPFTTIPPTSSAPVRYEDAAGHTPSPFPD